MKKPFWILALTWATAACQHNSPPMHAAVHKTASVASASSQKPISKPIALVPKDTLTPEMLAVLQRYDFSPLLQTVHGTDSVAGSHALNGFFGPDHYRIEVVFTRVKRDSVQPTVYHLQGQYRYKSVITPFAGSLTITQLVDQLPYSAARIAMAKKDGYELQNDPNLYSVLGAFELREEAIHRGGSIFSGQFAMDWKIDDNGLLAQGSRDNEGPTQGGGVKFESIRTNEATHRTDSTVWVDNIFAYAGVRHVLQDFLIGERDPDFNPKYAKLGWNSYWENDEWWADSPKPSLNL